MSLTPTKRNLLYPIALIAALLACRPAPAQQSTGGPLGGAHPKVTDPSHETGPESVLQPGAGADEDVSLEALMVRVGIPGLTIAVLEGGELVRDDVFGVESVETGEPVTSETLFEAASLSKPVFAYMVLRMVERGDLELDQPLHEILEYERFAGDPRALQLTPRLVLSHQTGLPNWGRDPLEFLAEPGERFGYSGEGYLYLQKCLEKMTGKTLDELARREVFGPLGMTRSRFSWTEEERPTRLAIGHDQAGTPRRRNPPEANAAGSLHTTAGDYARFLAALLAADGLEPETLRAAFEPAVRMTGDERGSPQAGKIAGKLGWGLGWGVQKAAPGGEPLRTLWHWGDNDTFLAFVALVPAAGSGVVYFTNSSNGLAVARQIVERFVGDMEPTFAWLGYAQSDDPGWAERRDGHVAERSGDYPTAVKHFTQALELDNTATEFLVESHLDSSEANVVHPCETQNLAREALPGIKAFALSLESDTGDR